MTVTVLCENTSQNDSLISEHGLSLFIETRKHKILFDMGQTDAYLHNAKKLGIDLKNVDLAILSHGHYDHGGGLEGFLEFNQTAPVYINHNAFGDYYNGTQKYIGLDKSLADNPRIIYTDDIFEIDEELTLFSCNDRPRKHETKPYGLGMKKSGDIIPDDFAHEQYLLISTSEKRVLISGCSHKGVLNIADWFSPDVFIGGFHFTKLCPHSQDEIVLRQAAAELLEYPTKYYTCHCTGTEQFSFMKTFMESNLEYISTGSIIEM